MGQFGVKDVKGVKDEDDAQNNGGEDAEGELIVGLEGRSGPFSPLELAVTLEKGKENRKEVWNDDNPIRRIHADGKDACERSEEEVQGEVSNVDEGKALEEEGVHKGVQDKGDDGKEHENVDRKGKERGGE